MLFHCMYCISMFLHARNRASAVIISNTSRRRQFLRLAPERRNDIFNARHIFIDGVDACVSFYLLGAHKMKQCPEDMNC